MLSAKYYEREGVLVHESSREASICICALVQTRRQHDPRCEPRCGHVGSCCVAAVSQRNHVAIILRVRRGMFFLFLSCFFLVLSLCLPYVFHLLSYGFLKISCLSYVFPCFSTTWHGKTWHNTARHGMARHSTTRHGTTRHGTTRQLHA